MMSIERKFSRFLGVISGTSADGVDVALVRVSGAGDRARVHLEAFQTAAYPEPLRESLFHLLDGRDDRLPRIARLHTALGEFLGSSVMDLLSKAGVEPSLIRAVGSHGQTVYHAPPPGPGVTLQLGSGAHLAAASGIPCVSDFRSADLAHGGQGAPLVPHFDWVTMTDPRKARMIVNIGGISNLTYLPPAAPRANVRAYDIGPGNMVIDGLVRRLTGGRCSLDMDGRMAGRGRIQTWAMEKLMQHPFIAGTPPKSAGRRDFGPQLVEELYSRDGGLPWSGLALALNQADLIATISQWTVECIARECKRFACLDEVILSGGGAKNPFMLQQTRQALAPVPVLAFEDIGQNGDAREATAFAFYASEFLAGVPVNIPSVTGARTACLLGCYYPV